MSFKPYTEKIKKKKIGICSILGRIRIRIRIRIQNRTRIRIHHPGSGSADPDPHQNDTDPKHCRYYQTTQNDELVFNLYPLKQGHGRTTTFKYRCHTKYELTAKHIIEVCNDSWSAVFFIDTYLLMSFHVLKISIKYIHTAYALKVRKVIYIFNLVVKKLKEMEEVRQPSRSN